MLTVEDIIEATGGKLLSDNSKSFKGISIDSRTIEQGEMFIAIRGEKFDGHEYVESALVKGDGAIVEREPGLIPRGKVIICVSDTLRSLQDIAHFLRTRRDIPLIAVTGSNGKTTTKEMISLVLSGRFRVLKNRGNLNNLIGLPLSLTLIDPADEVVVLEMGMNAAGEIRRLCEIAVPSHGVITNTGSAHVGLLGSYDAVRDAKLEIMGGLRVAVVNGDDERLMEGIERISGFDGQLIIFGTRADAHVMAGNIHTTERGTDFELVIRDAGSTVINLNVHGLFNVYNALAASAAGFSLGVGLDEIKTALETYRSVPMRFEVTEMCGMTVIDDSYNANPASIRESVKELVSIGAGGRVVAVLGDMHELREFSEDEHRAVGKMISEMGVDVFIAVGERMGLAAEQCRRTPDGKPGPEVYEFPDAVEAGSSIMSILKKGDTVLIKGSRSMSMERIVKEIAHAV